MAASRGSPSQEGLAAAHALGVDAQGFTEVVRHLAQQLVGFGDPHRLALGAETQGDAESIERPGGNAGNGRRADV